MLTLEVFHSAFEPTPVHVATAVFDDCLIDEALKRVFIGTNFVDSCWVVSRGQGGVPIAPTDTVLARGGARSTSVGDYVRVIDAQQQECFWRCMPIGWQRIDSELEIQLLRSILNCTESAGRDKPQEMTATQAC